jgi:hypothetical protein
MSQSEEREEACSAGKCDKGSCFPNGAMLPYRYLLAEWYRHPLDKTWSGSQRCNLVKLPSDLAWRFRRLHSRTAMLIEIRDELETERPLEGHEIDHWANRYSLDIFPSHATGSASECSAPDPARNPCT